jgi:hypothetical protein
MRIVKDLIPVLGDRDITLPVSTMKEMLPLLADGRTTEEIQEVYDELQGLTTRDAKDRIRELRGIERPDQPTTFRARVQRGEAYHRVRITRYGEDGDIYELTERSPLLIKPKDFARFTDRFGNFLEFVDEF